MTPALIANQGLIKYFTYKGPSMKPTFQPGQILYIQPKTDNIRPGDVIIYRQKTRYVVHRVISVEMERYITRGDNNRLVDAVPVKSNQVIGRVELKEYRGKTHRVAGGSQGLLLARWHWMLMHLDKPCRYLIGWPYRYIRKKQILVKIWKPKLSVLCVQTKTGPMYKYLFRQKTIATWCPQTGQFRCKRPFDLVLSPDILKNSHHYFHSDIPQTS
ncbi:signal peptidase I [candidate division KSB1 bacterium]|nr:signal peptidase I [candidate division KSB1 bacterium]